MSLLYVFNIVSSKISGIQSADNVVTWLEKDPLLMPLKSVYTMAVTKVIPKLLIQKSDGAFTPMIWDISTNGEFLFIWNHLQATNSLPDPPSIGVVVELGGGSGIGGSNSFNFIQQGWRGLIVEPFPHNAKIIRKELDDFPTATVAECAIDDHDGSANLFWFPDEISKTSSCISCENMLKEKVRMFGPYTKSTVTVQKIDTLFRKQKIPKIF